MPAATDTLVGKATTDTLTNKTINLANNTLTTTLAQLQTAVSDATLVDLDDTQTLTNKTLTSPTIDGNATFSGFVSGNIGMTGHLIFEGDTDDTFETSLRVEDPTADRVILLPNAGGTIVLQDTTDTLTNKSVNLANNTLTGTLAQFNTALSDDDFVSLTGTETLTNKTLTSPTITGTGTIAGTFTGDITGDVTGNAATATKIASITNSDIVQLTTTQTLTNKTLTNPTINAAALSGTLSGSPTFSGDITMSGTTLISGQLATAHASTTTNFTVTVAAKTNAHRYYSSGGNGSFSRCNAFLP